MADEMDMASSLTDATMERIQAERRRHRELEAMHPVVSHRECESCGEDIDPRRLKIVPSTRLCIDCQNELE